MSMAKIPSQSKKRLADQVLEDFIQFIVNIEIIAAS